MFGLILNRLLWAIPVLWLVFTLTFLLLRMAPGGPFDQERTLTPEVAALMQQRYSLDQPLWVQYWQRFQAAVQGDLGHSFQYPEQTVNQMIAAGFPVSAQLGLIALLVSVGFGLLGGGLSAWYRDRWPDTAITLLTVGGISVPGFVVAPLLIAWLAVLWGWFPVGGWSDGQWQYLVLPVLTLSLPYIAYISRITRNAVLEQMSSPFVRTARAKGLSSVQLLTRHVLRPALVPVVNFLGPAAVGLMTGSVVVEQIFGLPGLGRYFVEGALNRDYTLVLGVVLLIALLMLLFNLLADLLSRWLDPRSVGVAT